MTRHRCSVGNSYRSITGSSTDTINESIHTQSSFDSVNNLLLNGPSSPEANMNFITQQQMISLFIIKIQKNFIYLTKSYHIISKKLFYNFILNVLFLKY